MENQKMKSKPYGTYVLIAFTVILLFLALSFHYAPSRFAFFPKEHLTFSNTIILESDIKDLCKRYNDASFYEKIAMKQEPFFRKLAEKGLIYEEKDSKERNNE